LTIDYSSDSRTRSAVHALGSIPSFLDVSAIAVHRYDLVEVLGRTQAQPGQLGIA